VIAFHHKSEAAHLFSCLQTGQLHPEQGRIWDIHPEGPGCHQANAEYCPDTVHDFHMQGQNLLIMTTLFLSEQAAKICLFLFCASL